MNFWGQENRYSYFFGLHALLLDLHSINVYGELSLPRQKCGFVNRDYDYSFTRYLLKYRVSHTIILIYLFFNTCTLSIDYLICSL